MDGNARFQEEILAQLAGIIDRQVLQMVEAAVGSVLRNYEVTRKETALSTNIVEFPELDLFLGRLRYRNCSEGTIKQYRTTILGSWFMLVSRWKRSLIRIFGVFWMSMNGSGRLKKEPKMEKDGF